MTSKNSKGYHEEASGPALETVNAHKARQEITMFASCFCPFVQRVWIALEHLQIPYQVRIRKNKNRPPHHSRMSLTRVPSIVSLSAIPIFRQRTKIDKSVCHR
jgi:hypothetical protein